MFCKHCGKEIADQAIICPHCGVAVKNPPRQQTQTQAPAPVAAPTNGLAIAGFVLALLGFNLIALILSIVGLVKSKSLGGNGKGLAIAGIVISSLYILIIIIVYGALLMGTFNP